MPLDILALICYYNHVRREQESRRKHGPQGRNDVGAKIGKGAAREAATDYRSSNKKFVSLIMELRTCMVESAKLGVELVHLSRYGEGDFPNDKMELLEYAKEKWSYVWGSGGRYMGLGAGFDVVDAEEKRGYTLFSLQNIFMEIVKEISEAEIRGHKK